MSKFAKLYVPLALVSLVPRALRVLALYMPRAILDFVRQVLWCPRSLISCAFPALVLYVTRILQDLMSHVPLNLCALEPHVPCALLVSCTTCCYAQRTSCPAYLASYVLSCVTWLVSYVLSCFTRLFFCMLLCIMCLLPCVLPCPPMSLA